MIIFPAIDIKDAKSVRLYKGLKDNQKIYFNSPLDAAKKFVDEGTKYLHIVDLDGAFEGITKNFDIIKAIASKYPEITIQIGGGIRSLETAELYLSIGLKVIIGSKALEDMDMIKYLTSKYEDKIIVSVDCKNGYATKNGWVDTTEQKNTDIIGKLVDVGVKTFVYTDIDKDGAMSGPNFKELETINNSFDINLIASGGISTYEDVKKLESMGIYGAIIGKAIYEGVIDLTKLL